MSLLITDIADHLATSGVGTVGTDIFIGQQPPRSNDCITLYEKNGNEPSGYVPLKKPTIQVIVRNASYATGRAKAETVFDALHRQGNLTLGDNHAYFILATSDVGYIGRDENRRHEWSLNFRLETRDDS